MKTMRYQAPSYRLISRALIAGMLAGALVSVGGCALFSSSSEPETASIPEDGPEVPSGNTVVLSSGTQLTAQTAAGRIKIEAGPGLRRVFDWDGMRRGAITKPRKESFAGGEHKGITFDGTPKVWEAAHGITKLRYEEGYRDFDNASDALIWMQIRRLYFTYNDKGLAVGWKRDGDTLHVEVWQFTIDGKKPTSLPKSRDDRINEGPIESDSEKA